MPAEDNAINALGGGGSAGPMPSAAGIVPSTVVVGWNPITSIDDAHDRGGGNRTPKTVGLQEAYNMYYEMSQAERGALGMALYRTGIIKDPGDFDSIQAAWKKAVDDAAGFYAGSKGKNKVTPWDVLGMKIGAMGGAGGAAPRSQTSTSTSYNIPSPLDAEAGVKAIFSSAVGRAPTDEEVKKYSAIMVGLAKKNPSKSTSTTNYDASGNATTSSSSTGGIDAAGMRQGVMNQLEDTGEYGAYQAATTYFNVLMSSLAAPG